LDGFPYLHALQQVRLVLHVHSMRTACVDYIMARMVRAVCICYGMNNDLHPFL
jgi:hypothetical protein